VNLSVSLQEGKKLPKEPAVAGDSDSEEETPDEEFEIPAHKVKLMIGAGGEKIKLIQRRTKARIQVR
jgi:polyribonucleotide nucleotidyltransferase